MPGGLGRRHGNIRTALPHPPLLQQGVQGHHGAHGCRSGSEPVGMEDGKAGPHMTDTKLLYGYTAYSLTNVWSIPERRCRMDGCDRQDELVPVLPIAGSVRQFDTIRVDADQALLVQAADGLLEVGLADAKLGGDELRGALVAERQLAALRAQAVDNLLLQSAGGMATDRLQAEVDLAVGADLADVALLAHAPAQELEGLVLVNQPPVGVVDDGLEAQIGDLGNRSEEHTSELQSR